MMGINIVSKMVNKRIMLRNEIEDLITQTWEEINFKDNAPVKKRVVEYKQLRCLMTGVGIHREDVDVYDVCFESLPWEDCGYEVPKIK